MSRYRGPRFKLIRRLGILPGLTNKLVKKKKKTQNEKKTQYRIRLEEKQKLRFHYGINERQLLRYVRNARKSKGSTGQKLLQLLEMRLDNIVYRSGLAPTIPAARQLVNHGHIIVNDQIVDIPSYNCCINDNINPSEILKKSPRSDFFKKKITKLPYHLRINQAAITVNSTVDRKFVGVKVNELLIVEYYSRQA